MDINFVREAVLLLGLAAFVGIAAWAYAPRSRSRFERAAASVFEDDEHDALSEEQRAELELPDARTEVGRIIVRNLPDRPRGEFKK